MNRIKNINFFSYLLIACFVLVSNLSCKNAQKIKTNNRKSEITNINKPSGDIKKKTDLRNTGSNVSTENKEKKNNTSKQGKKSKPSYIFQPFTIIKLDSHWQSRPYLFYFTNKDVAPENRRLDIRHVNPYRNLPYPIDYMSEDSVDYQYDLSTLSIPEKEALLKGMRINEDALWEGKKYLKAFVKTPVVDAKGKTVAIAYHISYYSNPEDVLGTQGIVILYNDKGEEVRRIEDKKDGFYDILLSKDGKYLMQKYGFDYGEDGSGQLVRGFKFYNTETGEKIFEWELGKDRFLDGYSFFPNTYYYVNYYRTEGKYHHYYIIDINNKNVYQKSMDRKKYSNDYPGYRETLFPTFLKTKEIKDLIKDGFKKIN